MKKIFFIITMCLFCAFLGAQENGESQNNQGVQTEQNAQNVQNAQGEGESQKPQKDFQNHVIPVLGFQALQTGEKDFIFTPTAALQFMRTKNKDVKSAQPDSITAAVSYSQLISTVGYGEDEIKNLHSLSLMGNVGFGKNMITAMFSTSGKAIFTSNSTLTGGLMYTRELIKNDNWKFNLGLGVLAGDLGLEIAGYYIYVVPLPVFSLSYTSEYFNSSLSMMGLPSLSMTLFPKAYVRVKGECGIAGFSSIRDLTFDCALAYHPFAKKTGGDFLSFSAGVMNQHSSFTPDKKEKNTFQYYSVYGEINATFIVLRGGYNFNGKTIHNDKDVSDLQKGVFASIQAMYMF